MAFVKYTPYEVGDARAVAPLNTAFTAIASESSNLTEQNFREEGLDIRSLEENICHEVAFDWAFSKGHGNAAVVTTGAILKAQAGNRKVVDNTGNGFGNGGGVVQSTQMYDTSTTLPPYSIIRLRASFYFAPNLYNTSEVHPGISGVKYNATSGGAAGNYTPSGHTPMVVRATIRHDAAAGTPDGATMIAQGSIGELTDAAGDYMGVSGHYKGVRRCGTHGCVTLVGWLENATSSPVEYHNIACWVGVEPNEASGSSVLVDDDSIVCLASLSFEGVIFKRIL